MSALYENHDECYGVLMMCSDSGIFPRCIIEGTINTFKSLSELLCLLAERKSKQKGLKGYSLEWLSKIGFLTFTVKT